PSHLAGIDPQGAEHEQVLTEGSLEGEDADSHHPRSARRWGAGTSATLMPTMASPRPREALATAVGRSEERRVGNDGRDSRRHTRSKLDWSSDVCSSDLRVTLRESTPKEPSMSRCSRKAPWRARTPILTIRVRPGGGARAHRRR